MNSAFVSVLLIKVTASFSGLKEMEELSLADAEFELGSGECAVALIVVYLYGQERRTCTSVSEQPTNAILLFFQ